MPDELETDSRRGTGEEGLDSGFNSWFGLVVWGGLNPWLMQKETELQPQPPNKPSKPPSGKVLNCFNSTGQAITGLEFTDGGLGIGSRDNPEVTNLVKRSPGAARGIGSLKSVKSVKSEGRGSVAILFLEGWFTCST